MQKLRQRLKDNSNRESMHTSTETENQSITINTDQLITNNTESPVGP